VLAKQIGNDEQNKQIQTGMQLAGFYFINILP